jgi:hypothetical protein
LDEIYRGYRIAVAQKEKYIARIQNARGPVVPIVAEATLAEGAEACMRRARALVDRYISFLDSPDAAND